ncbi:MAG: NAD(P)H-dependent oxidoreductase, partial [Variovorax sp.]
MNDEPRRVLILQGHPDARSPHFEHALADAYAHGAQHAGHLLRKVDVAALDFPLLHSKREWDEQPLPPDLASAQEAIGWATHIVVFFPLWLGGMPALLKGFFEQVARPGSAISEMRAGALPRKLLTGRSARIVVTMGMPALIYRWFFRAHSLESLERNILKFCGIGPIREMLIGNVEDAAEREKGLAG